MKYFRNPFYRYYILIVFIQKLPKALIDAYFEAEDLRSLSLKEKLAHCVLSNGLAEKIRKRKEAKVSVFMYSKMHVKFAQQGVLIVNTSI